MHLAQSRFDRLPTFTLRSTSGVRELYVGSFPLDSATPSPSSLDLRKAAFQFVVTHTNARPEERAAELVKKTRLWMRFLTAPSISAEIDDLTLTAEGVLDVISDIGPSGLDFFSHVRVDAVQPEHLATALRTSYTWREEIRGWWHALEVARAALAKRGIDPDEVLYGMPDRA